MAIKCYAIENHPNDSRVKIDPDGIVQCLSSRMGTGGNNTPFVLVTSCDGIEREYADMKSYCCGNGQLVQAKIMDKVNCIDCMHDQKMVLTEQEISMEQSNRKYVLRRLTPVECARLQGFPDWWCMGLDTLDPSAEEIAFWADVFETHRRINRPDGKPKTRSQIVKWLQHPHSDGAEYSLWGNGISLPIVFFIMAGISWADNLS